MAEDLGSIVWSDPLQISEASVIHTEPTIISPKSTRGSTDRKRHSVRVPFRIRMFQVEISEALCPL